MEILIAMSLVILNKIFKRKSLLQNLIKIKHDILSMNCRKLKTFS